MQREIEKSVQILRNGQTILYPTDTVWGIGCDATNKNAVSKIFEIKERDSSKSLVVLVDSVDMLRKYVKQVPENVIEVLSDTIKPTTIIYNCPKNLAKNVIAEDNTVAIRIVRDDFCERLIRQFDKPIISTSANISGDYTPRSFKDISESILHSVDYIVNLAKKEINLKSSTIIKIMEDDTVKIVRD